MVAALRLSAPSVTPSITPSITNVVRRARPQPAPLVDARKAARVRVALRAWLCGDEGSTRGYALDLSPDGARLGGMGTRWQVGDRAIVKIVLDDREAPIVLRGAVARYAVAASCPEVCVRFLDAPFDDEWRLKAFLSRAR